MRLRDQVSDAHQNAVVDQFVVWLNLEKKTEFRVEERPNPPDAIIANGEITTWVEHTDLYRNSDEARSELTFVTPGEEHIPHSERPIVDPDNRIAHRLVERMRDKLSKSSYAESFYKYGQGYLVISERDPLFNDDSLETICTVIEDTVFSEDKKYIKEVYLAVRGISKLRFIRVNYHGCRISALMGRLKRYLTNHFSRREKRAAEFER